jgi:ectoine hydroxylase-related dioxygenase (phytanoyl-CoA dioxygenase family)
MVRTVQERPHGAALNEEAVGSFFRDGYLLVPSVLTAPEVARYSQAVLDLVPRDLTVPEGWGANAGRFKPYRRGAGGDLDDTVDTPDLLPLLCNERLYEVAARLLGSRQLRVFDGSVGITMRNMSDQRRALSQDLHVDASVPKKADQFLCTPEELQVGGCYYLTDVEPGGGGIHVVPGGHRWVAEQAAKDPKGRHLYEDWKRVPSMETVEVTGKAGDFAILHHLMPHAASHNRLPRTRLAYFVRYIRCDHAHGGDPKAAPRAYGDAQLAAMSPLGRKLLGVDHWS